MLILMIHTVKTQSKMIENVQYFDLDPNILVKVLPGHTDAVWQLAVSGQKLLSSSADGSVRIWDSTLSTPLQSTFQSKFI